MTRTCRTSSQHCRGRDRGLTLIEVLAGLALLAALLMTILTARSRAALQWSRANERIRAVEAADRLLSEWWQDPKSFPRAGEGVVAGVDGFRWRTRIVRNRVAERLSTEVVRLEVGRITPGGAGGDAGSGRPTPAASAAPIAVEVVLPVEEAQGVVPVTAVRPGRRSAGGEQ